MYEFAKILCLSITILCAQCIDATSESATPPDELDLAAIERDAQEFFRQERSKAYAQRISKFRLLKSLSITTNPICSLPDSSSRCPDLSPSGIRINSILATEEWAPKLADPTSPVWQWFGFCIDLYENTKEEAFKFWHEAQHLASAQLKSG